MHFPTKLPSHRVLCRFMITERIAIFRSWTNFTLWLYSRRKMNLNSRERTKIHYKPCNLDAFLCPVGRAWDFQSDGRALLSNVEHKFHVQPRKKMGIIFCSGQVKTIFNLMICWEFRLKPGLEYRTVRSFEDKLSSLSHSARLAQLMEHQTFNLRAMGSSPISGSNHIYHCFQTCTLNDSNKLKGLFWRKQNIWKKVGKLIFSSYILLSIRVMWHLNLCLIFVSRRSFVATWQERNFE